MSLPKAPSPAPEPTRPRAGPRAAPIAAQSPLLALRAGLGGLRRRLTRQQRTTFLLASGLSTAGSFAGLTAKGWLLMHGSSNPLLLALHFALLTLPTLVVSGPAGVLTDRLGSERVLVRAQWGLFAAAVLGAIAIPISTGATQAALLLLSTLGIGTASAYELTARNKYVALLVETPEQLGPYLTSFSVIFNVGKLVGPPLGAAAGGHRPHPGPGPRCRHLPAADQHAAVADGPAQRAGAAQPAG